MKYTIARQRNNKPKTLRYLFDVENEHDDSIFIDFTSNVKDTVQIGLVSVLKLIHEVPLISMDDYQYFIYLVVEKELFLVAKLEKEDDSKKLIFLNNHVMSTATKRLHLENLKVIHDISQKQVHFLSGLANFLISQL